MNSHQENILSEILGSFARNAGLNIPDDYSFANRTGLLSALKSTNPEIHQAVYQLITSVQSYSFLKTDKYLRLKAMDIWKSETERFRKIVLEEIKNIQEIAIREQLELKINPEELH